MGDRKLRVLSTFSGCGGSTLGYKLGGLDVIAACEFLGWQRENYLANHPGTYVFEHDVRKLTAKIVTDAIGIDVGELDVLDGSPPCSDFSVSGKRAKGWGKVKPYSTTEQRVDDLFFEYVRLARELQPKVVVGENVRGLTIGPAKGYLRMILEKLRASGYRVKAKVMNALYYGVPQARQRVIIMGVREDLGVEPSYPSHKVAVTTLRQALSGLVVTDEEKNNASYTPGSDPFSYWHKTPRGKSVNWIRLREGRDGWWSHFKLHWDRPIPTVLHYGQYLMHPDEPRNLTIKELKRCSGFPDDYVLYGGYVRQWEAIGRAVPPPMMAAVARQIAQLGLS